MQAVDYQGRPPEPIGYGNWPPEHPSRPMQAVDYRGWPAEHPSRPQEAVDYRGRAPQQPHQVPTNHPYQAAGYQGRPGDYGTRDYQGWPADYPSRPQEAVGYSVWPRPGQPGPGGAGVGGPGPGQQPLPAPAGFAGPSLRERDQAPVPRHARTHPPLPVPAYGQSLELRADDGLQLAGQPYTEDWPTDALQVVSLLLTGAEGEASKIRAEAQEHATTVRAEASAEATAVRTEATVEAARLREAAERDADAMRNSLQAMTSELNEVAAFVTRRLATPDSLIAEPKADPAGLGAGAGAAELEAKAGEKARPTTTDRPGANRPASTRPAGARPPGSRPAGGRPAVAAKAGAITKPEVEPKTRPSPVPAAKPGGKSRQQRAARMMMIAFISLFAIGTVSGTIEVFLHGSPFFVFRSQGTGATNVGLQENQGPGQPDAPGTHPGHHHAVTHHHQAKQHQPGNHKPKKPRHHHKPKKSKPKPAKHQAKKPHPAKTQPAKNK